MSIVEIPHYESPLASANPSVDPLVKTHFTTSQLYVIIKEMARELSETLEAQQKWGLISRPYVIAQIRRKWGGVIRYDFENLYSGEEYDGRHASAMPGDGSLIRLRVTESGDSYKLYYQRVTSPTPESDFSTWTYLSIFDVTLVASCAYEAKVAQFYIDSDKKIQFRESTDNGANWGSWTLLGYSPTTAVYGMDTAYKANGDIALFYIDQATVHIRKRLSGEWQDVAAWDKSTGNLSGLSVYYHQDWNLVITGLDSSAKKMLWTLIYGDGGLVAADTWSDLEIIIERGATEPYTYRSPCVRRPDTTRLYFVEQFTQEENLNHIWYSHMPPAANFDDVAWLEPVPTEPQSVFGLAFCQLGSYAWLTNANKVYRASATDDVLDISSRLLIMDMRQYPEIQKGYLKLVVNNTNNWYSNFARIGDEITIGIGYQTPAGFECSLASSFWITKYKFESPPWYPLRVIFPVGVIGTLTLEAQDAWDFLKRYKTRRPYSWSVGEKSVKELLQFFFARSGLDFEVQSASDAALNFKPEFERGRGASYRTIIKALMKMIPDQLIFREAKVILRNPTTAEAVDWTYHNMLGTALLVFRGRYGSSAWDPNRAEVWTDTFMKQATNWPQVQMVRDRLSRVTTPTYPDTTRAGERADAELRKSEILTGEETWMHAPTNCGLEPWDKIQITDTVGGVSNLLRRVIRLKTYWSARIWGYHQTIVLGAD